MFRFLNRKFTVALIIVVALTIIFTTTLSTFASGQKSTLAEFTKIKNDLETGEYKIENGIYEFSNTEFQYTEEDKELVNGVALTEEQADLYLNNSATSYQKSDNDFTDYESFYNQVLVYRFSAYLYWPVLVIIGVTTFFSYILYIALGFVLFKMSIYFANRTTQNYKVLMTKKILFLTIIASIIPIFIAESLKLYGISTLSYLIYGAMFLLTSNYLYKNLKKIGE